MGRVYADFRSKAANGNAEAQAWLENDEPMINAGKPLAQGRIARLVDMLATLKEEEEAENALPPP